MSTEEPIIELLGKSGKKVKVNLFDIDINCKVKRNPVNGTFDAFVSRWYRLPPGEFENPQDALKAIIDFQNKYFT